MRANALLVATAAALVGASRYLTHSRAPDDYDAIGFVLALDDFDLARFQPHFPGYPVYVALGKLAHLVVRSPHAAAVAVSSAAAAVTVAGLWRGVKEFASARAAWIAAGLYAGASLPWLTGAAALSDGTAAALAVVAFTALGVHRPSVSGVFMGLSLGTRLSYFPLALSWLVVLVVWRRHALPRALSGLAVSLIAWIVPLFALVGARPLVALGRTHLGGHFADWGGTIVTRPDSSVRLFAFARDLFFDGIAPNVWILGALCAITLFALWRRPLPSRRDIAVALVLLLPYALWAFFGQNVIEQPRHLLPLTILVLSGLGIALSPQPRAGLAAVLLVVTASLPVALSHRRTEAAAAQMAAYVTAHYRTTNVALFGGRSVRFARLVAPSMIARERTWLSEVDVDLARLDAIPAHVLVTSEVEPDPARAARLSPGPRFCRDAVLDRRQPCVQLFEYSIFQRP